MLIETETASGGFKYVSYSVNETYAISSTGLAGYARLVSQETNFRDKCGMIIVRFYICQHGLHLDSTAKRFVTDIIDMDHPHVDIRANSSRYLLWFDNYNRLNWIYRLRSVTIESINSSLSILYRFDPCRSIEEYVPDRIHQRILVLQAIHILQHRWQSNHIRAELFEPRATDRWTRDSSRVSLCTMGTLAGLTFTPVN